jgi:hypothetical protein
MALENLFSMVVLPKKRIPNFHLPENSGFFFWPTPRFYSSFRNLATGMFSCSRYLATVRRAML